MPVNMMEKPQLAQWLKRYRKLIEQRENTVQAIGIVRNPEVLFQEKR